jgi:MFS family permease
MVGSIIAVLFPLYLNSEGFSEVQIGNLFTIGTLLSIIVSVLLFTHSDIIGRKFYLLLFGFFAVLSSLIAAVFPPFFFLALLVVLLYMASRRSPFTFGKIFAIEKFKLGMGQSYGIFGASLTIGIAIGALSAGVFRDLFGFRYSFLICSFIGLISLLPIISLGEGKMKPKKFSFKPKFTKMLAGFILHRFVYAIGLGSLIIFVIPLYLRNVLLLPYTVVGVIIMVKALGSVMGFLSGKIADRYDFRRICYFFLFLSGLFFLSPSFVESLPLICLVLFLAEFAHCIAATTLPYFYRKVSTQLGRDVSIIESIGATLGMSVGPMLSGLIIHFVGYQAVFVFGGGLIIGSVLILYALFR